MTLFALRGQDVGKRRAANGPPDLLATSERSLPVEWPGLYYG
jgi:hypothetical protein